MAPRRFVGLLLGLGLAGPIRAQPPVEPVRSLLEIRQSQVVMQRWDNSCGAAALATVLTYGFAHRLSEARALDDLARIADPDAVRRQGGFSMLDLKRLAEAHGYRAVGYGQLNLEQLSKLYWPIVPMWQPGGTAHFVVVRGQDESDVELADPAFGRYRIGKAEFAERWRGGRALVVLAR